MMTPEEANANPFLGKTGFTPRPTHDGAFRNGGQDELKRDQRLWDQAKEWAAANERSHAAYLADLQAKKDAETKQRRDADEARATDELRTRYFRADRLATEEDFQRDLPEIRRQARIQAVLAESDPDKTGMVAGMPLSAYRI